MHDEFLHRLRKEPRPEFAARLRARLQRQSASPVASRAPSWVRTLVTLLLLSGTAFAFTAVIVRGFPTSWLELSRYSFAHMIGERTPASQHAGEPGFGDGAAAGDGLSPHSVSNASTSTTATAPAAAATSSSLRRGVPSGFQSAQLKVATSWSAYLYVLPIAQRINARRGVNGITTGAQIGVSVRDSDRWPGPLCGSDAQAPDMAYAFAPFGTVSGEPCPPNPPASARSVVALPVGYEAVALARSPLYGELDLTRREIFLALAKWIPGSRTKTVHANPNTTWRQVEATLGPEPIEFLGPPLSSAAGRSMIELLMEEGCKTFPWIAALQSTDPDRFARICRTVRTDGVYVEPSGNTRDALLSEPNAVGIIGLNRDWAFELRDLAVSRVDGEAPTPQSIDSGTYPGSRALYLYVRRAHVPPNVLFSLLSGEWLFNAGDSAFVNPTEAQFRAANSLTPAPPSPAPQ